MENSIEKKQPHWLDKPVSQLFKFNLQTLIIILILLVAIVSRLYLLGERVMSHDEINHVYFGWLYLKDGSYAHNPITHGPLQFHLLELSYFLFNTSDFSARIPAAVFSILSVGLVFKFRRYLGRTGSIMAALFFVISPFMLYYGRYARNEAIAIFLTLATIWSVLKYLDTGKDKYLYLTAAFTSLHFATKETAFIFTAQLLVFLGLLFLYRISNRTWGKDQYRRLFFTLLLISLLVLIVAVGVKMATEPEVVIEDVEAAVTSGIQPSLILVILAGVVFAAAFVFLVIGYGWKNLTKERSFGMMIFQFTLVLPMLSAFPAYWMGYPLDVYTDTDVMFKVALITTAFMIPSIILGGLWEPKKWLIAAGIYYGIFILFYTSIFANLGGIYTGLVGSLGYWLEQQPVQRGSQPWYYFLLIEMPIYEYLAMIGTFISGILGIRWLFKKIKTNRQADAQFEDENDEVIEEIETPEPIIQLSPTFNQSRRIALAMFLFFSITSVGAYMVAGEKMPWLTVHITWSMWLLTGWLVGKWVDALAWKQVFSNRGLAIVSLIIGVILSFVFAAKLWIEAVPPFSGKELEQLVVTFEFLLWVIVLAGCIYGIYKLATTWENPQLWKLSGLIFLSMLAILTARHAFIASYVNYDEATEYLVYAHAARGPKDALEEIESLSLRLTGGKNVMVGFDNHTAYPFWWYLRDYPNRLEYGESPTRDLRNYDIILVGDENYSLIDPIVQDDFISFEYTRMVWPNQDYFDLTFYKNYLQNPETRASMLNAIFQIWLNRNYEPYSEVTGQSMDVRHWNPSQSFKMFVRKDVAAKIWQYGTVGGTIEIESDPYEAGMVELTPQITLNSLGLNAPKGIAIAADGTLYIADSNNNRIVHLDADYAIQGTWGEEGVGPGQFNQPWGLAVDEDGYVYVADTWNHRIQKFTADGDFVTSWGVYGQAETGDAFWGPRDIVINEDGQLMITDTGNKRIAIFTRDGSFVGQFGEAGYQAGQMDEPVGLAISPVDGSLFVADTWNQRVQVFKNIEGIGYTSQLSWDIDGWYGQSLENKPFLTVDNSDRVYVADPEAARILVFTSDGTFINGFGEYDPFGATGFGLVAGLEADSNNGLWVTDSVKNEVKFFVIPNLTQ